MADGGDLKGLIGRLRSAGFPDAVIRAIVNEQVRETYRSKMQDLLVQFPAKPYWKRAGWGFDPKLYSAYRGLQRQEQDEVRALLGDNPDPDPISLYSEQNQFGNLNQGKMQQVQNVVQDYQDMKNNIYMQAQGGNFLASDRKQLAYLDQQEEQDLAKVMTPDELMDYELRSSNTAQSLRFKLSAFSPTEDEFKAIFKLQQAVDSQFGPNYGMSSPTEMQARRAQQQQADQQIAAALGPDRYAQYKEDTDSTYIQSYNMAQRLKLPDSVPGQVYSIQQDVKQKQAALAADTSLTPQARAAQNQLILQDASTRVSAVVGADNLEAWQNSNAGYWLRTRGAQVRR